ncbi:Bug family tripartite tricarboxylate transporter substrate binding protein [Bordetella muralis]|uniref:Bug family tripartite tricarboxylate transporter substrate binding protein n=1 Tax=Bordetella muralis TaxID=1649130 RepID=UPI0039EFCB31
MIYNLKAQTCRRSVRWSTAGLWLLMALSTLPLKATSAPLDYPNKAVTLIVPSPPGGIIDASTRLVAAELARAMAQPFVVENKGGGSGNVAYSQVARAAPDGYTLLASYSGFHVGNPLLMPNLPWSQNDLRPVALIATSTNVIAINPSVPAHTLAELISYLKAHPGELSYASQGYGSVAHIGTEILKQRTGTQILHIPYKGSGAALQDVLANQVQIIITTPPSISGHIKLEKLRALAVTGKTRYSELPDVPTTAQAGVPDYELETWVAVFAPAGTPDAIVEKLTTQMKLALEKPETRAAANAAGFEAHYEPPSVLARRVASEHDNWSKAVRESGIKAE